MDFGDFPKLRDPTAYVSADAIIYRPVDMKILVGIRIGEPWDGAITACFGGYINPSDASPVAAAVREVKEETGLEIYVQDLVGIYGPERYHHEFCVSQSLAPYFYAVKNDSPAHVRPVVAIVFGATVIGGKLKDTDEQKCLRWVDPKELDGKVLAFDHARALADFFNFQSANRRGLRFIRI